LQGGAGSDVLQGGLGHNTYIFNANSGHDVIRPTEGEAATLRIQGAQPSDVKIFTNGSNLVVQIGALASVQVQRFTELASKADWHVQVEQAGGIVDLALNALPSQSPSSLALAQRRDRFVVQQFSELTQLETRVVDDHPVKPQQSAQIKLTATGLLSLPDSLNEKTETTTSTTSYLQPVVTTQVTSPSPVQSRETYVSLADIPSGRDITGWRAVTSFNPATGRYETTGYFLPQAAPASVTTQSIRYVQVVTTQTIVTAKDAATQLIVTGSAQARLFHQMAPLFAARLKRVPVMM
jgi:hypothetical protein